MGNGAGLIGAALLNAGLRAWTNVRQQRYVQSEKNRLMAMKIMEDIDLPDNLRQKHQAIFNKEIEKLQKDFVEVSMGVTHKGLKTNYFTSDELMALKQRAQQLGATIQTVKQNEERYKKDHDTYHAHPGKYEADAFMVGAQVFEGSDGLVYESILSPVGEDLNVVRKKLQDVTPYERIPYADAQQRGFVEKRGDDQDRMKAYGLLITKPSIVKSLVNQMLTNVSVDTLAEVVNTGQFPESMKRAFNDKYRAYQETGINIGIRNDPLVNQIAIRWGAKNYAPTLLPDEYDTNYVVPEKPTQADQDKVPYEVIGDTIRIKKAESIIKNGEVITIDRIKDGKVYGIKKTPKREIPETDDAPAQTIPEKTESYVGNVEDVYDELIIRVPELKTKLSEQVEKSRSAYNKDTPVAPSMTAGGYNKPTDWSKLEENPVVKKTKYADKDIENTINKLMKDNNINREEAIELLREAGIL